MDITFENNQEPERGKLLLSDPFLSDGYFDRSVVLLCDHNEEGSFGFVLNNYIDIPFDEIAEKLPSFDTRVSIGGPVSKHNLFYLHTLGEAVPGSTKITDKIYAGGDFDIVLNMIKNHTIGKNDVRFFIGYAGWTEDQLKQEIEEHAWVVTEPKGEKDIMNVDNDQLWEDLMNRLGDKFAHMTKFPQNPKWN